MECQRDLMGFNRIEWGLMGFTWEYAWYSDENITIIQPFLRGILYHHLIGQ